MHLPQIQIHQQYGKLGIETTPATVSIRSPRATYEVQTTPAKVEIRSPHGDLRIDQSKAWDALALGNNLETMHRIYSSAKDIALQGIAKIVEDGNRMADISNHADAIAEIAQQDPIQFPEYAFAGEPSYDNVDIFYTAHKPEIEVTPGKVDINTHPNKPEVDYNRGKVDTYVLQKAQVEITPPQIDLKI